MGMTNNQPLTLTVEQAAQVLGIGRSTAYELVRSGDLKHIRLRRRIVVPVAHLAERLGVDRDAIRTALAPVAEPEPVRPVSATRSNRSPSRPGLGTSNAAPTLF
ncbi:MAG: helix-turn-helix domain-containing protein [Actinobacteria bacterium]|nr:helix-turn-helix domain-containing protein [Actinomycetota bacterium]